MDYLKLMPAAWRLRFPSAKEAEFNEHFNVSSLTSIRVALVAGVLLYALYGLLDLYSAPLTTAKAWFYRYYIGCPAILVALAFTYAKAWRAYLQTVMALMCAVAGTALLFIIHHCAPTEIAFDQYYVGLIIIMMFTGSWVRLRFWHALTVDTFLTVAYIVLSFYDREILRDRLLIVNNTVFLVSAYFVASLTSYFFEVDSRIDFIQRRTIEEENIRSNAQRARLATQATQLEHTVGVLKETQVQLVQKEKMAALGELTAGVAHEIQNPLNFVKNFAEVSREMLEELRQALASETHSPQLTPTVGTLLQDICALQEKIGQHSLRADAIVKGMLEHSHSSAGPRQPTNLNQLAEEALRLSYHHWQLQDPTFTATLTTELDPDVGEVTVSAPDIQRVLLNLCGNAFYAVAQKKQELGPAYTPEVTLATKRLGADIEIRLRDNGTGMSEAALHKVFQPFFTTKPTGKGTGLGLSLSFDIITKGHSGTLAVESREGAFAEFIITLPADETHEQGLSAAGKYGRA